MLGVNSVRTLRDNTQKEKTDREQVFNELIEAHSSFLYRYAFWRCQNRNLAEDLVQETYLRAWKRLDQLKDLKAAKSWLTMILRREHARLFERARPEVNSEFPLEDLPSIDVNDTRPEAFALREALAKLPEKYREPLVLQVLGGYSLEEIASMLNISKGAVMTQVFRAKEKLRNTLVREEGIKPAA